MASKLFENLIEVLSQEAEFEEVFIEQQDDTSVSFVDDVDFSRPISFTDPDQINTEWIKNHIWVHPEITEIQVDPLAKTLLRVEDLRFLAFLRSIVILRNEEDLDTYIKQTFKDHEYDEFMDMYPTIGDDCVGILWYYARCPIIILDEIRDTAKKMAADPLLYHSEEEEFHRGILGTIFHELYHLLASIRFIPDIVDTEDAAEEFCRDQCDLLFPAYYSVVLENNEDKSTLCKE